MEMQTQPDGLQGLREVARGFQDEAVMAVRVVAVPAAKTLVDQQRQFPAIRERRRRLQRWIIMGAQRVVGPVQHELPARARFSRGQDDDAFGERRLQVRYPFAVRGGGRN
jgi:hypothetical protein